MSRSPGCSARLPFVFFVAGGAGGAAFFLRFRHEGAEAAALLFYELLALANERLWLGHFDLAAGDTSPAFRYAVLLRGIGTASSEQVEDLVDIAVSECERFYPAFQLVIWGGKPPEEAMATAMIEPVGEA